MALHFISSSACLFCGLSQRKALRVRTVASEDATAVKTVGEEDKVKLGGSDLKVTRLGIGAWSWGDTSYWNNFEWDGMFSFPESDGFLNNLHGNLFNYYMLKSILLLVRYQFIQQ